MCICIILKWCFIAHIYFLSQWLCHGYFSLNPTVHCNCGFCGIANQSPPTYNYFLAFVHKLKLHIGQNQINLPSWMFYQVCTRMFMWNHSFIPYLLKQTFINCLLWIKYTAKYSGPQSQECNDINLHCLFSVLEFLKCF